MDYEKKYNDLVNDLRELWNCHTNDSQLLGELAEICPELEESEDERIRKGLIKLLTVAGEAYVVKSTGIKKESYLAYLEKQKYDRMKPVYDARESFESALAKAWNDYHNGYEKVDKLEDDYVECAHAKGFREGYLFGLEKQKEQMLKDAVEGYVNYYEDSGGILMAEAQVGCPYHNGDKVRIVVLKEKEGEK